MNRKSKSENRFDVEQNKQQRQKCLEEAVKYKLPTDEIMKHVLKRTGSDLILTQTNTKPSFTDLERQLDEILPQRLTPEGMKKKTNMHDWKTNMNKKQTNINK